MKNFFNINPKTKEYGIDKFVICRPDIGLKSRYDELTGQFNKICKRKIMPTYFSFAALFLGMIFLGIFMEISENHGDDLAATYAEVGYLVYVAIIFLALFAILFVLAFVRTRSFLRSYEAINMQEDIGAAEKKLKENLRIPENSACVDVLLRVNNKYPNEMESGKFSSRNFINLAMWVYKDDINLYFADTTAVWAIPLHSILTTAMVKKTVRFSGWNKDVPPNKSPQYKKMVRYNKGVYFIKSLCSVQLALDGEEWEILIPTYDIEPVIQLTGISPV